MISLPSRPLSSKDLAYDALQDTWQDVISKYDLRRRIEVLVEDWLSDKRFASLRILEVGCGLGYFSERLASKAPLELVATDIAPALVESVSRRLTNVECRMADAMDLRATLGDRQFDLVFSSEVIEHTPDPHRAVGELCRRVAPGGTLIVSCPNRRWIFLLYLAQRLGLRKHYQGYENWVRPQDLLQWVRTEGLDVVKAEGIHCVPWQFLPHRLLRFLDRKLRGLNYTWALNLAVMASRSAPRAIP